MIMTFKHEFKWTGLLNTVLFSVIIIRKKITWVLFLLIQMLFIVYLLMLLDVIYLYITWVLLDVTWNLLIYHI